MKAGKLSLLAAGAAVAALATIGITRGAGVVPITSWFLRSEAELLSLRRLLRDPGPWSEIESLSSHMTIWKVSSYTLPAGPGETCLSLGASGEPEKGHHRFEFASRKGMSSRVFRLDFTSCRTGPGEYVFALEHSGFGSNFQLGREPLARGTAPIRILRLALEDAVVSQELIDTLREKDLAFCQVVEDAALPGDPPVNFIFRAADAMPGEPGLGVTLEYRVEYDPAEDRATFERIHG